MCRYIILQILLHVLLCSLLFLKRTLSRPPSCEKGRGGERRREKGTLQFCPSTSTSWLRHWLLYDAWLIIFVRYWFWNDVVWRYGVWMPCRMEGRVGHVPVRRILRCLHCFSGIFLQMFCMHSFSWSHLILICFQKLNYRMSNMSLTGLNEYLY